MQVGRVVLCRVAVGVARVNIPSMLLLIGSVPRLLLLAVFDASWFFSTFVEVVAVPTP
jgi:hypothetical protein